MYFRTPLLAGIGALFCLTSALSDPKSSPTFAIEQLSYTTPCAEEDNVILKIRLPDARLKGVNILAQRPAFSDQKNLRIFTDPDFSGCQWGMKHYERANYYPKCDKGYLDENKICRRDFSGKILEDGPWMILGDRGTFWQPFMQFFDRNQRSVGAYKTLYIKRRLPNTKMKNTPPNIAALYADGYFRPSYATQVGEVGGWGGSFILGDSQPIQQNTTFRHHHNLQQLRIVSADDQSLHLEVQFTDQPDRPAQLVIHHDYERKGIDFFPPEQSRAVFTFVSMYRDETSYDIDFLKSGAASSGKLFDILSTALHQSVLDAPLQFGKRKPSIHNTLSPDFTLSIIDTAP